TCAHPRTAIYTLSLHDALPICRTPRAPHPRRPWPCPWRTAGGSCAWGRERCCPPSPRHSTQEGHEAHPGDGFLLELGGLADPLDQAQLLIPLGADGDHQHPIGGQLFEQFVRHLGGGGGADDAVVGGVLRPTDGAVAV